MESETLHFGYRHGTGVIGQLAGFNVQSPARGARTPTQASQAACQHVDHGPRE